MYLMILYFIHYYHPIGSFDSYDNYGSIVYQTNLCSCFVCINVDILIMINSGSPFSPTFTEYFFFINIYVYLEKGKEQAKRLEKSAFHNYYHLSETSKWSSFENLSNNIE